jgi:cupin 2 domain-containing protein
MNVFKDVKKFLENEEFQELASSAYVKIERIVSTGHRSPEDFWYNQEQNEWVLVLSGKGVIEYEDGQEIELIKGDYVNIPAHHKHRVKETSEQEPTVWLAVYYE